MLSHGRFPRFRAWRISSHSPLYKSKSTPRDPISWLTASLNRSHDPFEGTLYTYSRVVGTGMESFHLLFMKRAIAIQTLPNFDVPDFFTINNWDSGSLSPAVAILMPFSIFWSSINSCFCYFNGSSYHLVSRSFNGRCRKWLRPQSIACWVN